tara:strand:- start:503 stop:697 length:195 start_codon:yes stop_codon:yes gene_type:complete
MLVRLASNLYYDTPIGTIGYVVRKLKHDLGDCYLDDQMLYLVKFSIGTEECAWICDLEIIQEIK